MSVDERGEGLLQTMRADATEFAKANAERNYLEEFKKSKLAILMKQAEVDGHKTTAAQEREARAGQAYIDLLDSLCVATEKSEHFRWRLEVSKLAVAVWQTKNANERQERRAYGT